MLKNKGKLKPWAIVLTGGHAATTALATIEAIDQKKWNVFWIGSKKAVEGKRALTLEFKIFPDYGIECYEIVTGRLQRKWTRFSLISLFKIPFGFVHAFVLLLRLRPKVVISFGGYAALPVVVSAWLLRIPVIVHEQTSAIGLANKLSIPFATKIAISRVESRKYFPKGKTVVTGNPVQRAFFALRPKRKIGSPPTIYVTGGSRGAQALNKNLFGILPELVKEFYIIHQCGELGLPQAEEARNDLNFEDRKRYRVYDTLSPLKVPRVLEKADMVLGRAGANTVAEVIAAARPAIFVPIPWSQNDEQTKNASVAVRAGIARIIDERKLSPKALLAVIRETRDDWGKMKLKDTRIRSLDRGGATSLVAYATELARLK